MKQSLGLILLQILNLLVGLLTFGYIVVKIDPVTYSLIGINTVIAAFILAFSNSGLDTIAMRNILNWQRSNQFKRIKIWISQIVGARILFAIITLVAVIPYCFYLSVYKYDHHNLLLFICFCLSGVITALNDSLRLILKSFNHYLLAAINVSVVGIFGRLLAIFLFGLYGFKAYVVTIILLPIIASIPLIIFLHPWFNLRYTFNLPNIVIKLKYSKHLIYSSYISYLFESADQFLVSVFMKSNVFSSYSIGKTVLGISKNLIENIFDNLTQKLVFYKKDMVEFKRYFQKLHRIQYVLLGMGILGFILLAVFFNQLLYLFKLNKYPYISYFVLLSTLSQLLYLAYKTKLNFFAFFYSPRFYFYYMGILSAVSLASFAIFALLVETRFIFGYVVLLNLITLIAVEYIYKHKGGLSRMDTYSKSL